MRLPRFRLRTLMIAVVGFGVMLAVAKLWLNKRDYVQRSKTYAAREKDSLQSVEWLKVSGRRLARVRALEKLASSTSEKVELEKRRAEYYAELKLKYAARE